MKKEISLKKHKPLCVICNHPDRADIELDYVHCIPWSTIRERYEGLCNASIERHAQALKLDKKRDRKSFYWRLIEQAPLEKMTVENAIEAAKQLDRIERVIVDNPTPSNIQVVYSFGGDSAKRNSDGKDRLSAASDAVKVPPLREEISPL